MQLPDEIHRDKFSDLVALRLGGVPLPYITGKFTFMGLDMLAGPEASVPRRETEVTGAAALKLVHELASKHDTPRVLDVCTGSGNLGLALAYYEARCLVYGVDLHAPALRLARRNAAHMKVEGRTQFFQGDLFDPFEMAEFWNGFDMIVSNPPYVPSRRIGTYPADLAEFEPQNSFDGGVSGLDVIERLVREAPRFLRPGSCLLVEVGRGQSEIVAHMARHTGAYGRIQFVHDSCGDTRALIMTSAI